MGRAYLAHLKLAAVHMVNIGLEPLAFLLEIVGLEGGEIAANIGVQTGLALKGSNNRLGGIEMLLYLVKLVHGVHLHATDGLSNFL